MFNKIDKEGKQRFGIRKLSVGVCSVLLSTLLLGIEENTPKADAATTNNTSIASDAVDATENPQNQNTYVTTNMVLLVRQSCQYLLFQQKFRDSLVKL